jgi:signal transduction histidine kinase
MDMNIHLWLHNILYAVDVILVLSLIILIIVKSKAGIAKVMLIVTWLCVIIFLVSHILGVSVDDGELSRKVLMFNLIDIFLPLSSAHSVFALLSRNHEQRKALIVSYTLAIGLALFFIIDPSAFLLTSTPKLYFPNYYVPGPYYWLMLAYFFGLTAYFLVWMRKIYKQANGIEQNRIKYFFIALFFGYTVGSLDFLLIYNIPVDPLWGFLFVPLSVIPFTYAALRYELMSISVIAKKAFWYAVLTAAIGAFLSGLNYFNGLISLNYPDFPNIISSLVLAFFASIAVLYIWKKAQESDLLKYEFMNVVTHKFRTPLTSIKWISEDLKTTLPDKYRDEVHGIQIANEKLVELTGLLSNLSVNDDKSYQYAFTQVDLGLALNKTVEERLQKAASKSINIDYTAQPPIFILGDDQKLKFVFQTLLDNALSYTPTGGKITVKVMEAKRFLSAPRIVVRISDTGIGIPHDEIKYIFTKFYRAKNGKKADTEGMGIGLYLSRNIVEKHKGKINVESIGEGKGTTFTVVLPLME